jgi:hypothetical protein
MNHTPTKTNKKDMTRFNDLNRLQKEVIVERETINYLSSCDFEFGYHDLQVMVEEYLVSHNPLINTEEMDIMYLPDAIDIDYEQ